MLLTPDPSLRYTFSSLNNNVTTVFKDRIKLALLEKYQASIQRKRDSATYRNLFIRLKRKKNGEKPTTGGRFKAPLELPN